MFKPWLFIAVLLYLCQLGWTQFEKDKYGPYIITWQKYVTCKGPKSAQCGTVRIENTQNMADVIFYLDIHSDCTVTKARVTVGGVKNNSTMKLWNYSVDNPCQHFVLGPILTQSFNLTSSNCKINKGSYVVHLNMVEKSSKFLGDSFFYGVYMFKTYAHNNVKNFFCVDSKLTVGPT